MEWIINNNNTLYTTAYGTGAIYSSTDLGAHWSLFAAVDDDLSSMKIDGQTFLGTTSAYMNRGKIWRSSDGGHTWAGVTVAAGHAVNCLETNGSTVFAGTDTGVFISMDLGATWSPRNQNNGLSQLVTALLFFNNTLYAGSPNNGTFVSKDLGASWKQSTGIVGGFANCFGAIGASVYVTGSNGIYSTSDNGANWSPAESGLGADTTGYAISVSGGLMFLWTTPRDMYEWDDATKSWGRIFASMQESGGLMAVAEGRFLISTSTGIFVTDDLGVTAKASNTGMIMPMNKLAVNNGTVYAEHSGFIYTSTDQALTWSPERVNHYNDNTTIGYTSYSALTTDGANLLAGSALYGIFRLSSNATQVAFLLPNSSIFRDVNASALAVLGSTIYAGADNEFDVNTGGQVGGVFNSTDDAQTFNEDKTGLQDSGVTALYADLIYLYAATDDGGVYESTDNGAHWSLLSTVPSTVLTSLVVSDANMFGGSDAGVFVSPDRGAHWYLHNAGLTSTNIHGLAMDAQFLYASTDTGVWRAPIPALLGVPCPTQSSTILQVFPNPATSTSFVNFNLVESGDVGYEVFDALGRVVSRSELKTFGSGLHSIPLNIEGMPAGCYEVALTVHGNMFGRTKVLKE
jgi:photosystem II stability/assembly factor-like uncharacterized protein